MQTLSIRIPDDYEVCEASDLRDFICLARQAICDYQRLLSTMWKENQKVGGDPYQLSNIEFEMKHLRHKYEEDEEVYDFFRNLAAFRPDLDKNLSTVKLSVDIMFNILRHKVIYNPCYLQHDEDLELQEEFSW